MAELTHLTDEVQAVFIFGNRGGNEELYGLLERWENQPDVWDLRDGEGKLLFNGAGYESLIAGMAKHPMWPDEGLRIVYDTERSD
jgi:hypothetical protein